jgi:hypothetical protein
LFSHSTYALFSIARYLYFKIFSASFLITFLSPHITTSPNRHIYFSLPRIIISGWLLGMFPPIFTCWFHNIFTLLFDLYYWFSYMFIPVFLV